MSYILDALNKSQREHLRGQVPTLETPLPSEPPLRRHWWVLLIVAGTALAIAAALAVAQLGADRASATAADPRLRSSPPGAGQTAAPRTRRANEARTVSEKAAVQNAGAESRPEPVLDRELTASRPVTAAEAKPVATAVRAGPAATVAPAPVRPIPALAWGELDPLLRQAVGELRLNIHVYSEHPADRFAYINDRHYTEGDVVREGPVLEQVTPTGVVLAFRGERFRLDM